MVWQPPRIEAQADQHVTVGRDDHLPGAHLRHGDRRRSPDGHLELCGKLASAAIAATVGKRETAAARSSSFR